MLMHQIEKNKIVKEFYGCYHHGCIKCHPERKKKYEQTVERENIIKYNGFTIESIWECEWKEIKTNLENKQEIEQQAKEQNINVRLEMLYLEVELKDLRDISNVMKIKKFTHLM